MRSCSHGPPGPFHFLNHLETLFQKSLCRKVSWWHPAPPPARNTQPSQLSQSMWCGDLKMQIHCLCPHKWPWQPAELWVQPFLSTGPYCLLGFCCLCPKCTSLPPLQLCCPVASCTQRSRAVCVVEGSRRQPRALTFLSSCSLPSWALGPRRLSSLLPHYSPRPCF